MVTVSPASLWTGGTSALFEELRPSQRLLRLRNPAASNKATRTTTSVEATYGPLGAVSTNPATSELPAAMAADTGTAAATRTPTPPAFHHFMPFILRN